MEFHPIILRGFSVSGLLVAATMVVHGTGIAGAALVAALVIAGVMVVINRRAYRRIEELENV